MRGEASSIAETSSCHECVCVCIYIYISLATGPGRPCSPGREGFRKSCENKFQPHSGEQPSPLQNAEDLGGFKGLRVVFHPLQTPKGNENLRILQLQCTTNIFSEYLTFILGRYSLQLLHFVFQKTELPRRDLVY